MRREKHFQWYWPRALQVAEMLWVCVREPTSSFSPLITTTTKKRKEEEKEADNLGDAIIEGLSLFERRDNSIFILKQQEKQLIERTHQCFHLSLIRVHENRQGDLLFELITPTYGKYPSTKSIPIHIAWAELLRSTTLLITITSHIEEVTHWEKSTMIFTSLPCVTLSSLDLMKLFQFESTLNTWEVQQLLFPLSTPTGFCCPMLEGRFCNDVTECELDMTFTSARMSCWSISFQRLRLIELFLAWYWIPPLLSLFYDTWKWTCSGKKKERHATGFMTAGAGVRRFSFRKQVLTATMKLGAWRRGIIIWIRQSLCERIGSRGDLG